MLQLEGRIRVFLSFICVDSYLHQPLFIWCCHYLHCYFHYMLLIIPTSRNPFVWFCTACFISLPHHFPFLYGFTQLFSLRHHLLCCFMHQRNFSMLPYTLKNFYDLRLESKLMPLTKWHNLLFSVILITPLQGYCNFCKQL